MSRDQRALGYKLFGRGFDYLLHLRPAEWPIVTVHFLTGTALAVGIGGITDLAPLPLMLGTLAFVIGVNGGTLALNSAFDNDEGDIAYLRDPPKPPRGLAIFGLVLMLVAVAAAHDQPRAFIWPVLICVLLSIVYSVPPIRLKAVAGADWIVNMVGFGFLTPYAGWALSGQPLTTVGGIILGSFALLFGAIYPLTQLYQLDEDLRRGDDTLAAELGVSGSLVASILCAALAFLGFALAALRSIYPVHASVTGPGWIGLLVAAAAWGIVLLPWWQRREDMSPMDHQRGMHRALAAWAVTDLAVLFAFAL